MAIFYVMRYSECFKKLKKLKMPYRDANDFRIQVNGLVDYLTV